MEIQLGIMKTPSDKLIRLLYFAASLRGSLCLAALVTLLPPVANAQGGTPLWTNRYEVLVEQQNFPVNRTGDVNEHSLPIHGLHVNEHLGIRAMPCSVCRPFRLRSFERF